MSALSWFALSLLSLVVSAVLSVLHFLITSESRILKLVTCCGAGICSVVTICFVLWIVS